MFLVGLTGNYGMGKSTVLKMFQHLGAITHDADEIVASLLREQTVLQKIRNLLGEKIFRADGTIDKKKVADIIFANDPLRAALEDILHPLVFGEMNRLLEHDGQENSILVIETPLLFERHYEGKFHRIITVQTEQEKALARLEKKGAGREDALQRMQSQLPIGDKVRKSDFTIDNNGSPEETEQQVRDIYKKLSHEVIHGNRCRP
jgi:dephospho-CoA kinase